MAEDAFALAAPCKSLSYEKQQEPGQLQQTYRYQEQQQAPERCHPVAVLLQAPLQRGIASCDLAMLNPESHEALKKYVRVSRVLGRRVGGYSWRKDNCFQKPSRGQSSGRHTFFGLSAMPCGSGQLLI